MKKKLRLQTMKKNSLSMQRVAKTLLIALSVGRVPSVNKVVVIILRAHDATTSGVGYVDSALRRTTSTLGTCLAVLECNSWIHRSAE